MFNSSEKTAIKNKERKLTGSGFINPIESEIETQLLFVRLSYYFCLNFTFNTQGLILRRSSEVYYFAQCPVD